MTQKPDQTEPIVSRVRWPDDCNADGGFFEHGPRPTRPASTASPVLAAVAALAVGVALGAVAMSVAVVPPVRTGSVTAPPVAPEGVVSSLLMGELDDAHEQIALEYLAFVHSEEPVGAWARHRLRPEGTLPPAGGAAPALS